MTGRQRRRSSASTPGQTPDLSPHSSGEEATGAPEGQLENGQEESLSALEERLGVAFVDRTILIRALTHHSMCPKTSQRDCYDRLEFLGDALIGAQVVLHLFQIYPDANEGELTALKSEVVSRRVLAHVGAGLGLDAYIRVDVASLRTFNERSRESLRADVVEALVAAIHLDQGRAAAEAFVAREILPVIPRVRATLPENNPKGRLQQHVLRQMGLLPRYETLSEGGESNDRRYTVGVFAGESLLAKSQGSSIKEAGREAARAALRGELFDHAE